MMGGGGGAPSGQSTSSSSEETSKSPQVSEVNSGLVNAVIEYLKTRIQ